MVATCSIQEKQTLDYAADPCAAMYGILLYLWGRRYFAQTLRVLNWYAPQLPKHLGKS